jgi:hypothetical protein
VAIVTPATTGAAEQRDVEHGVTVQWIRAAVALVQQWKEPVTGFATAGFSVGVGGAF